MAQMEKLEAAGQQGKKVVIEKETTTQAPVQNTSSEGGKQGDDPIFNVVDDLPEFVGGQQALFKFLGENIKYPVQARNDLIEGTTFVSFVVEKDGSITNVVVKRTAKEPSTDTIIQVDPNTYATKTRIVTNHNGKILDDEAVRVVASMPKWKPGKNKGQPVRVVYTLPIKFKLE